MLGYYSLPKRGSMLLHCNDFDPEKALWPNDFFLRF